MKADAILFDKDGTLMDFDAFWVPVSVCAMKDVFAHFNREYIPVEEVLVSFGINNGVTDIDGILCKGTYKQMGKIVFEILQKYHCNVSCEEVTALVERAYGANASVGTIKPISPELTFVLNELKRRNKKLAVITTDNSIITRKCLEALGVGDVFDVLYTSDGRLPTKPDPASVFDFCERFNVNRNHMVMVGDTITDAEFAKNARIPMIGVAKTEQNKRILEPYAHEVVANLSRLLDMLE